jgi:hypothetical protein
VHPFLKGEVPAVKHNRGVDVVDNVADADTGHGMPPASPGAFTGDALRVRPSARHRTVGAGSGLVDRRAIVSALPPLSMNADC